MGGVWLAARGSFVMCTAFARHAKLSSGDGKSAANRVRQTGIAFTFEPMSANERRIIHLTLADSTDLFTESIGEGSDRKLRIARKN